LRDVTCTLSDMGTNVLSCTTTTHRDGMVEMRFLFQVSDISHIDIVLKKLGEIEGVFDARRMLAGGTTKNKEKAASRAKGQNVQSAQE
jgi:GTP diphosphokinase / guanosine-3',5'-bis(diphosphate) 3'-diphosphatase